MTPAEQLVVLNEALDLFRVDLDAAATRALELEDEAGEMRSLRAYYAAHRTAILWAIQRLDVARSAISPDTAQATAVGAGRGGRLGGEEQ